MSPLAAHIARETVVSALISGAISAAFFLGLFGLDSAVPVRGLGGFAADFVPQSAPVAFMACLVPALLARRAVSAGRIAGAVEPQPRALVGLALVCAMLAAMLGGLVALLWIASGVIAIVPLPALLLKIAYGALLGALVTRRVLRRLVRPNPPTKE